MVTVSTALSCLLLLQRGAQKAAVEVMTVLCVCGVLASSIVVLLFLKRTDMFSFLKKLFTPYHHQSFSPSQFETDDGGASVVSFGNIKSTMLKRFVEQVYWLSKIFEFYYAILINIRIL